MCVHPIDHLLWHNTTESLVNTEINDFFRNGIADTPHRFGHLGTVLRVLIAFRNDLRKGIRHVQDTLAIPSGRIFRPVDLENAVFDLFPPIGQDLICLTVVVARIFSVDTPLNHRFCTVACPFFEFLVGEPGIGGIDKHERTVSFIPQCSLDRFCQRIPFLNGAGDRKNCRDLVLHAISSIRDPIDLLHEILRSDCRDRVSAPLRKGQLLPEFLLKFPQLDQFCGWSLHLFRFFLVNLSLIGRRRDGCKNGDTFPDLFPEKNISVHQHFGETHSPIIQLVGSLKREFKVFLRRLKQRNGIPKFFIDRLHHQDGFQYPFFFPVQPILFQSVGIEDHPDARVEIAASACVSNVRRSFFIEKVPQIIDRQDVLIVRVVIIDEPLKRFFIIRIFDEIEHAALVGSKRGRNVLQ